MHVNTYNTFGRAPVSMADLRSNLNLRNHVLEYIFITRLTAVSGCGLTVSVSISIPVSQKKVARHRVLPAGLEGCFSLKSHHDRQTVDRGIPNV